MRLKQLKFIFLLKILFFVCKLLCQEKKFFLCAKDDLMCAKSMFPIKHTLPLSLLKIKKYRLPLIVFWGMRHLNKNQYTPLLPSRPPPSKTVPNCFLLFEIVLKRKYGYSHYYSIKKDFN